MPQDRGVLIIGITTVVIASTIARLGFEYTLIRVASPAFSTGNLSRFWGVAQQVLWIAGVSSISIAMLLAALGGPLLARFGNEPQLIATLPWFLVTIPAFSLSILIGELLKASDQPSFGNLVPTALPPMGFALLTYIAYAAGYESLTIAAIMYCTACWLTVLFGYIWLRWTLPKPHALAFIESKELWLPAKSLFWFSSLSILNNWIPLIALSFLATSDDWGRFGAATRLATAVSFILWASNAVVPPRIARSFASHDYAGIQALVTRTGMLLTGVAAFPVLIFALAGRVILRSMGEEFEVAYPSLLVLSLAHLSIVAAGSVDYLLVVSGHEKSLRFGAIIATTANILLCSVLIPWLHLPGAAISAALSILIERSWYCWAAWRATGVLTLPIPLLRVAPSPARADL